MCVWKHENQVIECEGSCLNYLESIAAANAAPTAWTGDTVIQCECGAPMLPNVSTWDDDGCAWICLNPSCGDYTASEIEPDDLMAVGVPEWIAHSLATLVELLADNV